MTDREAAIAFNMTPGTGYVKMMREAKLYGSAAAAWAARSEKLDWTGRAVDVAAEMDRARHLHIEIVTVFDAAYPERLRDLSSPPLCLYVAGSLAQLENPAVAMVGTRAASGYGREMAELFAYQLALAGWTVVSGLAAGIDAASHRGALLANNGGRTIGVLGSAIDAFYPAENRELGREILRKGGAVISEFPFGRRADERTFPQRNRIVAALSRGVVAVETPLKGGTLITCELANEISRPVMAVPGPANSRNFDGCHHLIRSGAVLVTSSQDILEELAGFKIPPKRDPVPAPGSPGAPPPPPRQEPSAGAAARPKAKLTENEARVLEALEDVPVLIDALIERTGLAAAAVNTAIVSLRMKSLAKFHPGGRISKNCKIG